MSRAAVFALALIVAGCGSAPAAIPTPSTDSARAQAVKFSACMRQHGVTQFPDPDASGELTVDAVVNGSSLDTSSTTWKRAISACQDLQPSGFTGHRRSEQQQAYALKFAQCMRDNGVPDFPDPTRDGALIDTTRIPSAAGRGALDIPGFTAATDKCGAIFADELGLKGR
ncbi:MAG TPA: hypothetical protein VNS09_17290 [Solirubrobacter sp.]|nr:hypothetical protein [Solirubrobacter sp.]